MGSGTSLPIYLSKTSKTDIFLISIEYKYVVSSINFVLNTIY